MDTLIIINQTLKLRTQQVIISNEAPKRVDWYMALRPLNADGTMGAEMARDCVSEKVDADLMALTPPPETVVEIAPGATVDISGIPMAVAAALLQWHGEAICASRKDAVEATFLGVQP